MPSDLEHANQAAIASAHATASAPAPTPASSPDTLVKDITTRVLALLVVGSGMEVGDIHLHSHLVDDLNLDSLEMANHIDMLEEEFGIMVSEDAILSNPTVSGVITHVLSRIKS